MKSSPPIPSCSNENFCFHEGDYSFGFNGKELDKEGMGGGASTYDYGFRIYNSALAKFLSVDPLSASFPWYTPYQFAGNMPIWAIDLDGKEALPVTTLEVQQTHLNVTHFQLEDGSYMIRVIHYWVSPKSPNKMKTAVVELKSSGPNCDEGVLYIALKYLDFSLAFYGPLMSANDLTSGTGRATTSFNAIATNMLVEHGGEKAGFDQETNPYFNEVLHVLGSAVTAAMWGKNSAKAVQDIHERYPVDAFADPNKLEDHDKEDWYRDIANNEWGRQFGDEFAKKNGLGSGVQWTDEISAKFLNEMQDYFKESFPDMKFNGKQYSANDSIVKELTKSINSTLDYDKKNK